MLKENEETCNLIDEYNVERYGVPNEDGNGLHNEIWLPVRRKKNN